MHLEPIDESVDFFIEVLSGEALESGEELQVLAHGELVKEHVVLRTQAEVRAGEVGLGRHVVAREPHAAASHFYVSYKSITIVSIIPFAC